MAPVRIGKRWASRKFVMTDEASSTRQAPYVLHAFLQFARREKHGERSLKRRQCSLDVVSLHFRRLDTNARKRSLDRALGEYRRQAASLNYLVEERVHAILFRL